MLRAPTRNLGFCIQSRCASSTVNAFAVVLGGGMAGSSCAFHLTQRNIRDIVLLEKQHVASPSATSFHSPGLVSSAHPAHRYKPILAYSVDLYSKISALTGEEVQFDRPGTLRLATNETRLAEFQRYVSRDYYKEGDVCKTSLLSAAEAEDLAQPLKRGMVLGGLYTSNDGYIDARGLNRALVKGAVQGGAKIFQETVPEMLQYDKGTGEWLVGLRDGTLIRTRNVVNAGGIWANDIARLSGLQIPMLIVEHQYAIVTPKSGLPDSLPAIIDHDSTFYIRRIGDKLIFGGFESLDQVVIREDWYRDGVPKDGSIVVEPDFNRLERAFGRAKQLLPLLEGAEIEPHAAVFSMTPDGYPLVGAFEKNYWLSTAFLDGVSSAGGIGKYLADWIFDGEPNCELFDTDASRYDRWANRKFVVEKGRETYSMFYNWSYTDRLAARPTDRISGIYGTLCKDGAIHSYRNGWEVPQMFVVDNEEDPHATLIREYQRVTNRCGVIDMSWKGKLEVKGKDANALMDYAVCSEVPPLGKIGSGLMLTRAGRILAPLKIFHHDNVRSQFILLTEPERESRDLYWLRRAAADHKMDVQVNSVSEYLASLALVGPKSRELLSSLTKSDVSDTGFAQRSTRLMRLGAVAVVCARSSTSTGQLSYELFHNRADTLRLYNAIMEAGAPMGIVNFGQSTMNMMRLEHGFKIWGRELSLDTNPFECGLGGLVDIHSGKEFIGKSSSLEHSHHQWTRRLSLIVMEATTENRAIPYGNEVLRREGSEERIGQVTSGAYSGRLQRPMAFAWINSSVQSSQLLSVDIGGGRKLSASILEELPHAPIN